MLADALLTTDVDLASAMLAAGGLVAFPTETVYGLGADASSPAAVARIYAVKGRPAGHPVIVHVADQADVDQWAEAVPEYAAQLMAAFWPGPLTVVLPRKPRVGDAVAGGSATIGLRCPSHPVARQLIETLGRAIAAPSANRFGRVSPTEAVHVLSELGGALEPGRDAILDGGSSDVGLESTIVDCTGDSPIVLRPGAVTADDIQRVTGFVPGTHSSVRAPGTLDSHYSPLARVLLCEPDGLKDVLATVGDQEVGVLAPLEVALPERGPLVRLALPVDVDAYGRELYSALRRADDLALDVVVAVLPPDVGMGHAVRDRLTRAAHGA